MALKKQKLYKGFTADYWRIIAVYHHVDRVETVVDMALYKDRASRLENEQADVLETKKVILPLVDGNIKAVYGALKKQKVNDGEKEKDGFFVNATNILESEK